MKGLREIRVLDEVSLWMLKPLRPVIHNLFGTKDQFHGRQFLHGLGVGGGGDFPIIQTHYIYHALYF